MGESYNERHVKSARKPHRCLTCDTIITPGDSYYSYGFALCELCHDHIYSCDSCQEQKVMDYLVTITRSANRGLKQKGVNNKR